MNPLDPPTKSDAALDQLLALTFGSAGDAPGLDAVHKERFEVLGTLGVGGMGSVFRARDRMLDRQVALKLVHPELLRNDEARSRFQREGRILSQFNHPNLCQLYDYVRGSTSDVLVMELVEGQTLAALLEAGATETVPRAERLRWMLALTQALAVAHGAGIIHRDLKPANVMVTQDGVVKVLDFGIAREGYSTMDERSCSSDSTSATNGESALRTQAGRVMGTPQYMSPEQKRGDVVGAASDLYALGLILDKALKPRASGWRDRELRSVIAGLSAPRAVERPTALAVEQRLCRWIALPRRRAIQAVTLGTLLAFGLLAFRYVRDLGHERDLVLARQGQSERVIAFLVDDVAERLEEVGPPELLAELDRQSIDYFHAVDAAELTDPEMRRWVAAMLGVGQRIRTHERLKSARKVYLAAEAFLDRRLKDEPMSTEWRFEAGQVNFYLGEIARDLHDQDGALRAWTRYRDLSAELLEGDPGNATLQDELAYAKTNLGVLAFERDELNLAETYFRDALSHWEGRVQAQPKQTDWVVEQADSLSWVSETLRSQGQFAAALSTDREVRDLQQALFESDRGNRLYEHRYVLSLYQVARSLGFTGQHAAAASVAEAAHVSALELSSYNPNQGDWARTCALTASLLALNLLTVGRAEEAEPVIEAARRQLSEMRHRDPSNQDWQSLSVLLSGIASETSLARGDLLQAQSRLASVDQELASLGPQLDCGDLAYLEIQRLTADSLQAQATNTPSEDPLTQASKGRLSQYLQGLQPSERWKLERVLLAALIESNHLEFARDWRATQLLYFQPSSFHEERLGIGLSFQSSGASNE